MPPVKPRTTPGVYITELAAFPPTVVGVQTAVPAFIGYTEKAEINKKPVYMKPVRIGSLADYEEIFGKGFRPEYDITPASGSPVDADDYDFRVLDANGDWQYYSLEQTSESQFYLYNSMRLFYANGGGRFCYVVSVGNYDEGTVIDPQALQDGLKVIGEEIGPTMLVVPDAVLVESPADFSDVTTAMLKQCGKLQDRVAILDVWGSENVTDLDAVILGFRTGLSQVPAESLSYGMAYFPFLQTTVVPQSEISYKNIASASLEELQKILTWENDRLYPSSPPNGRHDQVQDDIDDITDPDVDPVKLNQNLTAALPLLKDIERIILEKDQELPPSGAMAGVYTFVDGSRGVWNAPANLGLASVVRPTYKLTNEQQGDLNVPIDGLAVNAIREFPGRGAVVWGARTLDGNSNDYRYIQVRRTLIYLEQSIKNALDPFVFAANDANTWTTVVSMVSSFLQGVWSQGGLMGATASEAFSVQCGLGSTMTAQDILEGYMVVQVVVQMVRPAEFIELTFRQKMEG